MSLLSHEIVEALRQSSAAFDCREESHDKQSHFIELTMTYDDVIERYDVVSAANDIVTLMDLGDGRRQAAPQAQPRQQREHISQADETMASLTQEVVHLDLGDGQRWAAPQGQSSQERELIPQTGEIPEVVHRDLGDGQRWAAPQAQLRHRRGEPRGRSSDILQPSIPSPSKQGKDIPRGAHGRVLLNSLLRCAQAMAFTFVMYHVTLEWL
ncbi:hypothetical protein E2C01_021713 [Portunus trituberculatus]|uniref:Uncharacterized protein n=1 Tax=Portunus trituberculatus TaxID=210409 RepID=A0A5B7E592_PORTR|nr:hypothetical protein [Portunus trituberculatus]